MSTEAAAGNTINTISISLGFHELAALANLPTSHALVMLPSTLAIYQDNYTQVLSDIRALEPTATLYMLGYYNPFPANPTNPAAPIFAQGGPGLNAIIQNLATEFNADYVNTYTRCRRGKECNTPRKYRLRRNGDGYPGGCSVSKTSL